MPASAAKERILQTAHDLFYQRGIRATGIDRVIAESSVTKRTFYRHFPSKNDLILAFLEYRHERWLAWFQSTLVSHGNNLQALIPTLSEWFAADDFRGCAFLNAVGELGSESSEIIRLTQRHKQDMVTAIEALIPPGRNRKRTARSIAVAVDGAVVWAQFQNSPTIALEALKIIVRSFS